MISKDKRLTRDLFKQLSMERKGIHSPFFVLKEFNSPQNKFHFGVSVSKKVSKSAVVRNRTRRRIYSQVRTLKSLPSHIFLIIAKPGSERLKGDKLHMELAELFKRR